MNHSRPFFFLFSSFDNNGSPNDGHKSRCIHQTGVAEVIDVPQFLQATKREVYTGGVGLVTHILPVGRGAILSFRSLVFFALPSISLVWSSSSLTTNRELLRGDPTQVGYIDVMIHWRGEQVETRESPLTCPKSPSLSLSLFFNTKSSSSSFPTFAFQGNPNTPLLSPLQLSMSSLVTL